MVRSRHKVNLPMTIAMILLCLVLITTHLTSGLYARYTTRSSSSDRARVIKFGDITLTESADLNGENKLVIVPGVDLKKEVLVDFGGSESSTFVFLEMILPNTWNTNDNYAFSYGNNQLSFSVLPWNETSKTGWKYLDNTSYVYYVELSPNTTLSSYEVIVDDVVKVSNSITKDTISSMTDISIQFQATVVQSNGFDSVEDAWNSIYSKKGA